MEYVIKIRRKRGGDVYLYQWEERTSSVVYGEDINQAHVFTDGEEAWAAIDRYFLRDDGKARVIVKE
jgi:hypothetical protein